MTSGADGSSQQAWKESRQALFETADDLRQRARELTTRAVEVLVEAATLQRESAALVELSAKLRDDLRGNVSGYAATMRQLGEPAERVVVSVKGMADEALGSARPPIPIDEVRSLREDLVRWTIDGYYAASA